MTKVLTKKEYDKLPEGERQMALLINDIITAKEDIAKNILKVGEKLYIAKEQVPHGEWETWLADKVDFSVRSAQTYIKTYKIVMDLPEKLDQTLTRLGSSKLVEIATIKKDDIEKFITNTHVVDGVEKTVEDMSVRELKEVIKDNKKSKKKPKQDKNADVCVNKTEKVIDVDFKESHENEDKLKNLILEQQRIEKELEVKRQQVIDAKKELILENNLNLEIVFEEEVTGDLLINVYFYMYVIRNNTKQFIEKYNSYEFETLKLGDEDGYIYRSLRRNKELLQEEKDFILKKCYEMKDYIISRDKILREERRKENEQKVYEDILGKISKNKIEEPQEVQDIKKEFIIAGYKALAKKYHPDCNQGNAEAEDKFKAIGILKDTLLQQNLLN